MQTFDWIVLGGYFAVMATIGVVCMFRIKRQEDFFMGGRSFGKIMQTFAAFGAGTGSNDPVQVGAKTWTSGLAGIWSVLMWLFVTPFYWIFGVWYRRMRHLTIGDWYVERYQSPTLGAAYAVFGTYFYMFYLSALFTAVVKVAIPLIGADTFTAWEMKPEDLKFYLIPAMGLLIIIYGILGGLKAAYWTDLIQGIGIIVLSIILIPTGLNMLVDKFDPESAGGMMRGLEIMHENTPAEYFQIFGGPRSTEFPLHYIVSLTLLALIGIVVQPHFIATGGGSAKNENSARIGLVTGNFLKRFCTVGWALTGVIVLTLFADNVEITSDPDLVWGVASREILSKAGAGLVGLMLACMLAAMMSSADCYMIMTSGLITRNFYKPVRKNAGDKELLLVGRISGLVMIVGAGYISILHQDVFKQFVAAITLPVIFAATFWLGMWWRKANKWSAWLTVLFVTGFFFVMPRVLPNVMPDLAKNETFAVYNRVQEVIITRPAKTSDLARRQAWLTAYNRAIENENANQGVQSLGTIGNPVVANAEAYEAHLEWEKAHQAALADDAKRVKEVKKKSKGEAGEILNEEAQKYLDAAITLVRRQTIETIKAIGPPPDIGNLGAQIKERFKSGGAPVYWSKLDGKVDEVEVDRKTEGNKETIIYEKRGEFTGNGQFRTDLAVYSLLGMDLQEQSSAMLTTLGVPPKLLLPFLFMIAVSFITPKNSKDTLDRFYTKMKVPVMSDADADTGQLKAAYENPEKFESRKWFPGSSIEIQKPRASDFLGFIFCFAVCFGIVWFAVWLMNLGAS